MTTRQELVQPIIDALEEIKKTVTTYQESHRLTKDWRQFSTCGMLTARICDLQKQLKSGYTPIQHCRGWLILLKLDFETEAVMSALGGNMATNMQDIIPSEDYKTVKSKLEAVYTDGFSKASAYAEIDRATFDSQLDTLSEKISALEKRLRIRQTEAGIPSLNILQQIKSSYTNELTLVIAASEANSNIEIPCLENSLALELFQDLFKTHFPFLNRMYHIRELLISELETAIAYATKKRNTPTPLREKAAKNEVGPALNNSAALKLFERLLSDIEASASLQAESSEEQARELTAATEEIESIQAANRAEAERIAALERQLEQQIAANKKLEVEKNKLAQTTGALREENKMLSNKVESLTIILEKSQAGGPPAQVGNALLMGRRHQAQATSSIYAGTEATEQARKSKIPPDIFYPPRIGDKLWRALSAINTNIEINVKQDAFGYWRNMINIMASFPMLEDSSNPEVMRICIEARKKFQQSFCNRLCEKCNKAKITLTKEELENYMLDDASALSPSQSTTHSSSSSTAPG